MERAYDIEDLKRLMERLRDPAYGCPWDLKQTYQSIAPFTLEECLELIDALEQSDYEHVEEELGDLLFQVIFYAQLGKEEGRFDFDSVVSGITQSSCGVTLTSLRTVSLKASLKIEHQWPLSRLIGKNKSRGACGPFTNERHG